ncbi:Transposable element Tcb2 transposase-like 11 [Homarus americanus]|uniref:Transposable element Tcb2 transposase-like 11 n=1 Tax=Homarus americanus TaxID=6706 RepID=A0A8J5K3P2_HOMAM|nr:Transposable element Tcb2 transposase-like 11 [Homarus americanus]
MGSNNNWPQLLTPVDEAGMAASENNTANRRNNRSNKRNSRSNRRQQKKQQKTTAATDENNSSSRRQQKQKKKQQNQQKTTAVASAQSIHLRHGTWWIAGVAESPLADVDPGWFTGHKYRQVLEGVLLPPVEALFFPEGEPFYLVQDNSPIHTSRVVKEWFGLHPYITLLPHPPRSLDLNHNELVWATTLRGMGAPTNPCRPRPNVGAGGIHPSQV